VVDELLKGHESFRDEYVATEGAFLRKLASQAQSPAAFYVGCSDSRVVPELLTSSSPGELFVVRNVANLLPRLENADASVGAALEYAVGVLEVPHLVVCGHYGCGGVEAMLDGGKKLGAFPSLVEWLANVTPAVESVRPTRDDGAAADRRAFWRRAVERNVVLQLANVTTFPVARAALEAGTLALHGWVYDIEALELRVYDGPSSSFRRAADVLEN
jgi:carbonic anhydrase